MKKNIGELIRSKRKEKKMTLVQVAEKTELSHSYLSQLENGKKNNPSWESLKKIADAIGEDYFNLMAQAGYISEEDAKYRKEVLEKNKQEQQKTSLFLEENQKQIEEMKEQEATFILDNARYYNGHIITDNDKVLIKNFLDALFTGRE